MAGKPKSMSDIKQLLLLHQQGKGKKTIARILGVSKNTVKTYLSKIEVLTNRCKNPTTIDDLVKLENPELEAKFHGGNPAYKEADRYDHFKDRIAYFLKELKRKGVTKRLLWEEYRAQYPDGYGYSQFCFHLQQQQIAARPSMVLTHKPGEKLYVDFAGKKMHYLDRDSGEVIDCQIFVACLPYSDYGFAMAIPSQSIDDFLYALSQCLEILGGVPELLVPDNLKSAVIKSNRFEPTLNQALSDFASHYRMTVVPARVRKPQDKALVENQVKLVYTRVYAPLRNITFHDITSLNKAIKARVKAHNQTRMQQKPYCREERFLAKEKKQLHRLPEKSFMLKYYLWLKVAKNNHIYLSPDKHYYSVPYVLIGRKVKVIYTRKMVYIFSGGKQVAVHIRNRRQGGYSTEKEHLCSHHRHYLDRSPDYYIQLAAKKSDSLRLLVEALFNQDNKHPEQLYKSCDGLLSLARKADTATFEKACRIALENEMYSYLFIKNILENNMIDDEEPSSPKPLPDHKNIRGKNYYKQQALNFKNKKAKP